MIVRAILDKPELADNFNYFNDYHNTFTWLHHCDPSEKRDVAMHRLENGYKKYMGLCQFECSDGGRKEAGFKRKIQPGDCVCRAIALAAGMPYREVYDMLVPMH